MTTHAGEDVGQEHSCAAGGSTNRHSHAGNFKVSKKISFLLTIFIGGCRYAERETESIITVFGNLRKKNMGHTL